MAPVAEGEWHEAHNSIAHSHSDMKKYFFALFLFPILLVGFAATGSKGEEVISDDDDTSPATVLSDDGNANAAITYLTLVWDRNPEQDVVGYKVYYGRVSGDYTQLVTVTNPRAKIGVKGSKTTLLCGYRLQHRRRGERSFRRSSLAVRPRLTSRSRFMRSRGGRLAGGGGGIRTHEGLRPAGFQDRSHQPLDHPSSEL